MHYYSMTTPPDPVAFDASLRARCNSQLEEGSKVKLTPMKKNARQEIDPLSMVQRNGLW